jgi:hypothetical protein
MSFTTSFESFSASWAERWIGEKMIERKRRMDRKAEIKSDLWKILKNVYKLNEEKGITVKQEEFLDKMIEYLDSQVSLRRKIVKEKPPEKKKDEYVNPDWAKFDS